MGVHAATTRTLRTLEEAERRFVVQVASDGGIGPWRAAADQRLRTALDAFTRRRRPSRRDAADLIVALVDEPSRDRCWRAIDSRTDVDWRRFWVHLSRRALPPYRTEPLFLFAWSAWRVGDFGLARPAVDDVLADDPGHRAAGMLLALLSRGVEPSRLPSLGIRPTSCAGVS